MSEKKKKPSSLPEQAFMFLAMLAWAGLPAWGVMALILSAILCCVAALYVISRKIDELKKDP